MTEAASSACLGKRAAQLRRGDDRPPILLLDEDGEFRKRVNPELVEVLDVDSLAIHEGNICAGLITEHVQHTGSQRGEEICPGGQASQPNSR